MGRRRNRQRQGHAPLLARTLRSLRHRDYRFFLAGHAVSVLGTWMQRVAQDWLVLQMGGSGVALGVAAALQFGPVLVLGMWGGSVADHHDRRRLVLATQAASGLLAAVLAVATFTGLARLWVVYLLALALGLVTVVDNPARQALLAERVPEDDYVNAQALNSTVHNLGRLVGPALAGVLIAVGGVGLVFAVNAVSFAAVLVGLVRMRPGPRMGLATPAPRPAGRRAAYEGLRFVLHRPELTAALVLLTVISLLGQNFRVVLPLLARNELHTGAAGYGALTSALGLGAVVGALFAAARERVGLRSLLVAAAGFAATNLLAAATPSVGGVLIAVVALGVANILFNTLTRTVLQLGTPAHLQGRVIALYTLISLGTTPIGGPLLGWWSTRFGARAGLLLAGGSALVAVLGVAGVAARRGFLQPAPDAAVPAEDGLLRSATETQGPGPTV